MSLLKKVRQLLLEEMIQGVQARRKILIVDKNTVKILSSACRMFDVMEAGASDVEHVAIKRQPLPFHGIYFLSPDDDSVKKLLGDFTPAEYQKSSQKPQYTAVHLFFSSRLSDKLFKKIQGHAIVDKIATLKELNVDVLVFESQAFHFDSPNSFKRLYAPSADSAAEQTRIAGKLATLCKTLGERPIIRYARSSVASKVAEALQEHLDVMDRKLAESSSTTLLILDRTVDSVAPLLHEFTYQAMIYDLLNLKKDQYKYEYKNGGKKNQKTVLLDERDFMWPKLRHLHIAVCITWILSAFNEFQRTNKVVNLKTSSVKEGPSGIREINRAMKEMPQFQEQFSKFSLHIRLVSEVMSMYKGRQLERLAQVEQKLATGENPDKTKLDKGDVTKELQKILEDPSIREDDKLRVLLVYLVTQKSLKQKDREKWLDIAHLSEDQRLVAEHCLQLNSTEQSEERRGLSQLFSKNKNKKGKDRELTDEDVPYDVSRYVPVVKEIGSKLITGELSTSDYPYLGRAPSKGKEPERTEKKPKSLKAERSSDKKQATWGDERKKGKGKEKEGEDASRFIIFIAGGATFSEIRSAYELTKTNPGCEVILGSTFVMNPTQYLDELKDLNGPERPENDQLEALRKEEA